MHSCYTNRYGVPSSGKRFATALSPKKILMASVGVSANQFFYEIEKCHLQS